ncbi:MAG: hypothetical protein J1E39_04845 [Eubacterium sp.]|nr:hypothetical protein [Eubacterium sp.]
MEKLVSILTNKWLNLGVSVLSVLYPVLIIFTSWIYTAYYIEPVNQAALYVLYIFINVIFGGIMLFTRKQIVTVLCAMITPLLSFLLLILTFGNWIIIIPPVAVCVLIFFICGAGETAKTIIGTLYLILYVVGVLVYLTLSQLIGDFSLTSVDLSLRSTTYNYSPDKQYRIVTYAENYEDERRSVSFYLERASEDISIPFAECRRVLGSIHVITSAYDKPAKLEWKDDNTLYIDGRRKEFEFSDTALLDVLFRTDN